MITLGAAATDLIRVVTGSAADVEGEIDYVDYPSSGALTANAVTGDAKASITTAATTTVVTGAASTKRCVRTMQWSNRSATSTTLLVERFDNTNAVQLAFCTLLQNESLVYSETGIWVHYDANCAAYPSVGNLATQAEMEAATATDKYVSPGRAHFNPGVAKFVAMTTGTATPALQTPPSYNITSITDNGVGDLTVTINNDFSSANWCCQVQCEQTATTYTEASANVMRAFIRFGGLAAGTIRVSATDFTTTTNVVRDPISWHLTGHGDL